MEGIERHSSRLCARHNRAPSFMPSTKDRGRSLFPDGDFVLNL